MYKMQIIAFVYNTQLHVCTPVITIYNVLLYFILDHC